MIAQQSVRLRASQDDVRCARAASGHAAAAPPSSVMNSRRLTAQCPVLPTARIAQVGSAEDLLRCGIRTHLLTASGQKAAFGALVGRFPQ